MSNADKLFKKMCRTIIDKGTDTAGDIVRAKWEDGTPAYTKKIFGITNTYDLRKEFPALTLRKTGLKSCMDEILWIFQKKSNNIHDLKPHIWDAWADANGSIGKAYGYQIGKPFVFTNIPEADLESYVNNDEYKYDEYPSYDLKYNEDNHTYDIYLDQIDSIIYQLKYTPYSRRIQTSIWNFEELHEMNLQPCCWSVMFNVTDERKKRKIDKLTLNMTLVQRSNDVLAANNWNICQYSILLMMIAQISNMEAGCLLHVINDAHIYDRHITLVEELISRDEYPAPNVSLNPDITNFYDFKTSDLNIENYVTGEQIKNIPIAI